MDKRKIIAIVVLMAVALFGLISLQVYWVSNALKLKEQQFSQNVNQAMVEVIDEYQRILTKDKLKTAFQIIDEAGSRSLIINEDTVHFPNLNEQFPAFSSAAVHNRRNMNAGSQYNDPTNLAWETFDPFMDLSDPMLTMDPALMTPEALDWYTGILQDLIYELQMLQMNFERKVDLSQINNLLSSKLDQNGVDLKYQFAVTAPGEYRFPDAGTRNNGEKVLSTQYQMRLFPGQVFSKPTVLHLYFPKKISFLLRTMWIRLSTSVLLILIIIFGFAFTIWTIFRQKKLSEMKNDFINNMTHEFKTPLTTISLAGQALSDPDIQKSEIRLTRFSRVILDESRKLSNQVEKILQMAVMDKGDFNISLRDIDIHEVIRQIADSYRLRFEQDVFNLDLEAKNPVIVGDALHLGSMVDNLVDNAIKYSNGIPAVTIKTRDTSYGIQLSVADKGIGMTHETQKRIFEKFYRLSSGNVHDTKGFGLGLAYVKSIVDAHQGKIDVRSQLGEGTTFIIYIPHHPAYKN